MSRRIVTILAVILLGTLLIGCASPLTATGNANGKAAYLNTIEKGIRYGFGPNAYRGLSGLVPTWAVKSGYKANTIPTPNQFLIDERQAIVWGLGKSLSTFAPYNLPIPSGAVPVIRSVDMHANLFGNVYPIITVTFGNTPKNEQALKKFGEFGLKFGFYMKQFLLNEASASPAFPFLPPQYEWTKIEPAVPIATASFSFLNGYEAREVLSNGFSMLIIKMAGSAAVIKEVNTRNSVHSFLAAWENNDYLVPVH